MTVDVDGDGERRRRRACALRAPTAGRPRRRAGRRAAASRSRWAPVAPRGPKGRGRSPRRGPRRGSAEPASGSPSRRPRRRGGPGGVSWRACVRGKTRATPSRGVRQALCCSAPSGRPAETTGNYRTKNAHSTIRSGGDPTKRGRTGVKRRAFTNGLRAAPAPVASRLCAHPPRVLGSREPGRARSFV